MGLRGAFDLLGVRPRPSQLRMAEFVLDCWSSGVVPIVVGGTGSGKTHSYLAAIVASGCSRAVVATATRQLQDQVHRAAERIGCAALKGRQNYEPEEYLREYYRAQRERVAVVNYSTLFSAYCPPGACVVFDEAHLGYQLAAVGFGGEVSAFEMAEAARESVSFGCSSLTVCLAEAAREAAAGRTRSIDLRRVLSEMRRFRGAFGSFYDRLMRIQSSPFRVAGEGSIVGVVPRIVDRFRGLLMDRKAALFSATLDASLAARQFGIERWGVCEEESPFDYAGRSVAYFADLNVRSKGFSEQAASLISEVVGRMRGYRGLVLVTSKQSEHRLAHELAKRGISVCHSAREFSARQKALLVTTHWEGLDFADLDLVVVSRLPFSRPHGLQHLLLSEVAGDDFSLFLADAVVRFRQGIGRLMRNERSRGMLLVLDRRIKTAGYGQQFSKHVKSSIAESVDDLLSRAQKILPERF